MTAKTATERPPTEKEIEAAWAESDEATPAARDTRDRYEATIERRNAAWTTLRRAGISVATIAERAKVSPQTVRFGVEGRRR